LSDRGVDARADDAAPRAPLAISTFGTKRRVHLIESEPAAIGIVLARELYDAANTSDQKAVLALIDGGADVNLGMPGTGGTALGVAYELWS
jgi:hypothetical protein